MPVSLWPTCDDREERKKFLQGAVWPLGKKSGCKHATNAHRLRHQNPKSPNLLVAAYVTDNTCTVWRLEGRKSLKPSNRGRYVVDSAMIVN